MEGQSDKDALEPILSELVDNTRIHFKVSHFNLPAVEILSTENKSIVKRL